jgi:hypothetical protein
MESLNTGLIRRRNSYLSSAAGARRTTETTTATTATAATARREGRLVLLLLFRRLRLDLQQEIICVRLQEFVRATQVRVLLVHLNDLLSHSRVEKFKPSLLNFRNYARGHVIFREEVSDFFHHTKVMSHIPLMRRESLEVFGNRFLVVLLKSEELLLDLCPLL